MKRGNQSGIAKLRLLVVFLVILVMGAVGLTVLRSNSDKGADHAAATAGNSFMISLVNRDATASYNLMSSNYQQQFGSKDDWKKELEGAIPPNSMTFKLLKGEAVAGGTDQSKLDATQLTYEVAVGDKNYRMHLIVITEKDTEKINYYDSILQ